MIDIWWGLVEKETPGVYDWSSYNKLLDLIASFALKVKPVMSFHQCGGNIGDNVYIPLPDWIQEESLKNPDIFYTDQSGWRNPEYISLGCDTVPALCGRTPLQCYADFMSSFRDNYKHMIGGVIMEIDVGLGPSGELRYPAYPQAQNQWTFPGIGEFQCYDKYMRSSLKARAEFLGKPEYNRIPDDAGTYNQLPNETEFWKDDGAWKSPYGQFFLTWYTDCIISHGDIILAEASRIYKSKGVVISAKISGIHWHFKTASHATEVAVGYYNVEGRDGYLPIARMFGRHNVAFDFTCFEMTEAKQAAIPEANSNPERLIEQVVAACRKADITMSGENALSTFIKDDYDQIVRVCTSYFGTVGGFLVSFSYLRLSKELYSSDNWPLFVDFVKNMSNVSAASQVDH